MIHSNQNQVVCSCLAKTVWKWNPKPPADYFTGDCSLLGGSWERIPFGEKYSFDGTVRKRAELFSGVGFICFSQNLTGHQRDAVTLSSMGTQTVNPEGPARTEAGWGLTNLAAIMHQPQRTNKLTISRDQKQNLQFQRWREGKVLLERLSEWAWSRVAMWYWGNGFSSRTKRTFFTISSLPLSSSGSLRKLLNLRSSSPKNEDKQRVRVKENTEIWKSLDKSIAVSNTQDKVRQC